jgi:hypothetical protein
LYRMVCPMLLPPCLQYLPQAYHSSIGSGLAAGGLFLFTSTVQRGQCRRDVLCSKRGLMDVSLSVRGVTRQTALRPCLLVMTPLRSHSRRMTLSGLVKRIKTLAQPLLLSLSLLPFPTTRRLTLARLHHHLRRLASTVPLHRIPCLGFDHWNVCKKDILSAWRRRSLRSHPDRVPQQLRDLATAYTQQLNAAKDVLTDRAARRRYHKTGHLPMPMAPM